MSAVTSRSLAAVPDFAGRDAAGEPQTTTGSSALERVPMCTVDAPTVDGVLRELDLRSEPERVAQRRILEAPWSPEARTRRRAHDLALQARLDVFRDDLRAIRIAHEVLSRAATMRAVEAAETAILEIRARGETMRLDILNRAHLEMTRQFLDHLERLDSFAGRVPPEILDALRERALNEFTNRMNRASKADVEFARGEILGIRP
jgi:hypothetical protein